MIRRLAVVAIGVLLIAYGAGADILQAAGSFLIVEDPPAAADAIVVLAGSVPDRMLEAVDLYNAGHARRIVLSRGRGNPPGFQRLQSLGVHMPRVFELNRSVAEQLGVPAAALTEVGGDEGSTYDEAQAVLRHVHQQGYTSLLLVTSKYHSRRAALIYRFLAGDGLRVISRPTRYDDFDADRWWRDRTARRRVVIEYQKLLVFQLIDRWRMAPAEEDGHAA